MKNIRDPTSSGDFRRRQRQTAATTARRHGGNSERSKKGKAPTLAPQRMAGSLPRPPHFFKVVLPSVIETKMLRIPPKFVKQYGPELTDVATLHVPEGCEWRVGLKKDTPDIWFDDGWHEFVEHHSITNWYFLVFEYQGNSSFQVLVFDMTACEIKYSSRFLETKDDDGDGDEHDEGNSDDDDSEDLDYTLKGKKKRNIDSAECSKKMDHDMIETNRDRNSGLTFVARSYRSGGKKSLGHNSAEQLEKHEECKAKVLKLNNPSFRVIMKRNNRTAVYIPSEFASRYLKRDWEFIKVQDSKGRKWRTEVIKYKNKYLYLTKGWPEIFKANDLKIGDSCVFELIKMKENIELKLGLIQ